MSTIFYSEKEARYAREARAFFEKEIGFKVADMATKIEAARLLRIKAARMLDQDMDVTKAASMAKVFAAESAFWVASEAMQIMGGIGYTSEYPIERHFRDLRFGMIGVGSNEIMRLLIQREV